MPKYGSGIEKFFAFFGLDASNAWENTGEFLEAGAVKLEIDGKINIKKNSEIKNLFIAIFYNNLKFSSYFQSNDFRLGGFAETLRPAT